MLLAIGGELEDVVIRSVHDFENRELAGQTVATATVAPHLEPGMAGGGKRRAFSLQIGSRLKRSSPGGACELEVPVVTGIGTGVVNVHAVADASVARIGLDHPIPFVEEAGQAATDVVSWHAVKID